MSRWPIRLRLTAAFALAMLAVLAGAGLFVYLEVRAELDESVTASLRARADAAAAEAVRPGARLSHGDGFLEPEESFVQIVSSSGELLDATGGARAPVLDAQQLGRAAARTIVFDADVKGIEATARVLARRAAPEPRSLAAAESGSSIVVVGQSLDDRDETLASLLAAFAFGGPIAVAIASLLGYLLASAGLAPIEAMRRRATKVSLERDDALPLPAANDEVRRLGETLNAMLERLRGSFERERRFVADASHELRTPLAVLKAEIEAALRNGSYDPEVGESLTAALEECDQLAQLAEDLLVLARAGDGELALRREELRVDRLLESVRERFSSRARQQDRHIAVETDGELRIDVDPLRMRQALGNLVDNALRHGRGQITLAGRRADGGVHLTVADAGPGFAPELARTAFDRFTRGDAARPRGGAGLGLAIVQSIARAHGGEADILPGEASVVRIRLPAL